jgi:hypothetical protein
MIGSTDVQMALLADYCVMLHVHSHCREFYNKDNERLISKRCCCLGKGIPVADLVAVGSKGSDRY